MGQADFNNIRKVVLMPEYTSLLKYYDNLIFRQYKQAIIDEDLTLAKSMVKLLTVLKNYPKVLIQSYGNGKIVSEEAGSQQNFSNDLKADGEEFL